MSIVFRETQFLGYNIFGLSRRLTLAIFCFLFYFFSDSPTPSDNSSDIFFFLGLGILLVSLAAIFIKHLKITVEDGKLNLSGPFTHRKVQIRIKDIRNVHVCEYSGHNFNRAIFNLHRKGTIRFYTNGRKAVKFETTDGSLYVIGSNQARLLCNILAQRPAAE